MRKEDRGWVWPLALSGLLIAACVGCASVKATDSRLRNARLDHQERREAAGPPGHPWAQVLVRERLVELAETDPAAAAMELESRLATKPVADGALALAELSYRAGLERQSRAPEMAASWFRDAATLATLAIQEPGSYGHEVAILVHNRAVSRLIRISRVEGKNSKKGWQKVLYERGIELTSPVPDLEPRRFDNLFVAADFQVKGMNHVYRTQGLGVPLIVHRTVEPTTSNDPLDRFHPRELRSAATAVIAPGGGLANRAWRTSPATLTLFDPFQSQTIRLGTREFPMAGDRTTPLAVQVSDGTLANLEFIGLFDSEFRRRGVEAGLYMFRPYEPGKIPVVLVHGLFSSPRSFVQTLNELGNDPQLSARYQFWVFLYPTGQLIPASARELRASLRHVKETLDPDNSDPSMSQMVLIGHSMGGVLSKMMAQESGMALWSAAFHRPVGDLKASPNIRALLEESLIFQPLPFVKRLVFIATPHRGSPIADQWFGRTIASLIKRSSESAKISKELVALNGPDLIAPEFRRQQLNAISNLRTDSPILKALDRMPIDSRVTYHSIIPLIGGTLPTDGVVEYPSSHLEGVESEMIVPGTHFSQQHPDVTSELKRILQLHLDTLP